MSKTASKKIEVNIDQVGAVANFYFDLPLPVDGKIKTIDVFMIGNKIHIEVNDKIEKTYSNPDGN